MGHWTIGMKGVSRQHPFLYILLTIEFGVLLESVGECLTLCEIRHLITLGIVNGDIKF